MNKLVLASCIPLFLAGCSSARQPRTEGEKIVSSVLTLLASRGSTICVDQRTREHALAVYREMSFAPAPVRQMLKWSSPRPLWPETGPTAKAILQSQARGKNIALARPESGAVELAGMQQLLLTSAANRLVKGASHDEEEVSIDSGWAPARVKTRWWLVNRIRGDCVPQFTISKTIRARDIAFVTVQAEHWGTLYALRPSPRGWDVVAEWSRWLY